MKNFIILYLTIFTISLNAQEKAYKSGEWLKFRIHYGIFNASEATLHVTTDKLDGKSVYKIHGEGKTTGLARAFFKVDDVYQSYINPTNGHPYKFVRKINEGGYTKDVEINFDHQKEIAVLNDKKNDKQMNFDIQMGVQDLISAFYYIRNKYEISDLAKNDFIQLDMLFDDDGVFPFKLKYLGKEILKTKYGKVECLKFRPYVQSGRVFKEEESLSLWVSNDKNKIPVRIKAEIAVGSIKVDLDGYNGLKNQFKIIMD